MEFTKKTKISFVLIFSFFMSLQHVFTQNLFAEGYFTSEARVIETESEIFVSIKKYNPTETEVKNAGKQIKDTPFNYLMIPFESLNIALYQKNFESKIYSLDKKGQLLWDFTIGFSDKSIPSPIKIDKGYIYTGESDKVSDKVLIKKIDNKGNLIWETVLDSLNNVNDIFVEDDLLCLLVSFDVTNRVKHNDGTFSEEIYPIYFYVKLDIKTGKKIDKVGQKMANYLSSMRFTDPLWNSDYSFFLRNKDSVVYLNTDHLEKATVVNKDMSHKNSIINLAVGNESYHILTILSSEKNKKYYNIISDFYGEEIKYESKLPKEYNNSDRSFIFRTKEENIGTIIWNSESISIFYTNKKGKSTLYKEIEDKTSPIVGVSQYSNKICILQIEGRTTPGSIGRLKLEFY